MTHRPTIELSPEQLRFTCDEAQFDFTSTASVPSLTEHLVGQERALRALNFGTAMPNEGYNIYAMSPPGSEKTSTLREFLERRARRMQRPTDWCYVQNFANPDKPHYLSLPPGKGVQLREDMEEFISEIRQAVPRALESEDYENERNHIMQEVQRKQNAELSALDHKAQEQGFLIQRNQMGVFFVPMADGQPMTPEQAAQLTSEQRNEIDARSEELQVEFNRVRQVVQAIAKEGTIKSLSSNEISLKRLSAPMSTR